MKCRTCMANTEVESTRAYRTVFLRRVRLCFNGHRFSTYEVLPGNLDRRTIEVAERAAADRKRSWQRKAIVARSPDMTATELAAKLNITEARVRAIRAELKTPTPSE